MQPPPPQAPVSWQAPVESYGPAPGVRFGGYGARLLAYIVDGIILGIVIGALTLVLGLVVAGAFAGAAGADSPGAGAVAALLGGGLLWFIVVFALSLAYFPWFWARGGQTPGMRLCHIRIVRDVDGGPISASHAIVRLVGYWVSGAVFDLGFIWVFVDKRRRGWHDLIAGTVVIESN
jgi:uncharacterized RDD family membrane protein YckC